ncbi:MAG: hypothetical protein A2W04_01220 [Betaproteobacteria bacterium RBG_16_64_9]|nr:MAG: hypothetical protein A2W04_01220 [Betaproteobacteria bacterium RBG_16_64_9]OGA24136.1 MAG: hypothetical protein A3I01_14775 [Betaproteobacteria bacterium RIFCSPLOWO2_02_FULL_65_24]OGA95270.1 MAG: hypothetical protein A3G27_06170 [Betaproteobacteria bacterium RIFCSPLOWO2_12_FULL_66_14]
MATTGLTDGEIGSKNEVYAQPGMDEETEFEDLAAFRLKPEDLGDDDMGFQERYAAYLRKRGLEFD